MLGQELERQTMNARERNRLLLAAEQYFRSGNQGHAKLVLENFVATDSSSSKAYELLGYIHGNEGNLLLAHQFLDKACRLPRHSPEALYYLGVSHLKQNQPRLAIDAFDRSIALGGASFEALHERGTAYSWLGDSESALQSYTKALRFNRNSFDLVFNIGKVYDRIKDRKNAQIYYGRALELKPDAADVWAHLGAVLYDAGNYAEAIAGWEKALSLAPDIEFLPGFLMHARLRLCDWSRWDSERAELPRHVGNGENACGPFEMLAISGAEEVQLHASRKWVGVHFPNQPTTAAPLQERSGNKIRVGYFSADFGRHAVSYLTAELFERHDRDSFEIFGFALDKAAESDEMRARLVQAFDDFIEVKDKSEAETVGLARNLGIDIAVDLGGHTKGSRTGLFRDRVAPVQVNYLGYPGTTGADFMDYMIADEATVPERSRSYYSERIAYLPDCFQPSDGKRPLAEAELSRHDFALPGNGFVFCCFNNSYKINPDIFSVWMRILAQVDGSCLWILADAEQAKANLRAEAKRMGIDIGRLVFAESLPYRDYLTRFRLADLFLDTLPFNGGTTANDALWAGLPVLTRTGESFAGRMASSLLKALGLPELIVSTAEDYEATAVRLARHPAELGQLKERLKLNREKGPLFDMHRYTRHLEAAYREMHRRFQSGLSPDHIHVARLVE
jgi:protein O-GlcNAc transferase